jgi:MYXO-CTERM domain-containing protein
MTSYALLADNGEVITSFVTGDVTHDAPPAVPEVVSFEARSVVSHEWGYEEWFLVDFDLQHEGVLVVMDREQTATMGGQPSGKITDLSTSSSMLLGRGECVRNYDGAGENVETSVRFGAFDLAGNFSGWTEPMSVTFDALPGESSSSSSCRIAEQPSSALAGALVLLAAVARRRKTRGNARQALS